MTQNGRYEKEKEIWEVERCVLCLPLWGQDIKQDWNKNQNILPRNQRNIQIRHFSNFDDKNEREVHATHTKQSYFERFEILTKPNTI